VVQDKKRKAVVDGIGDGAAVQDAVSVSRQEEAEADRFATNNLLPPREYKAFVKGGGFTRKDIMRFASEIGVAPGIVVGRLQHDKHIPWNRHNCLKAKYTWETE
jgi:hypothetical protein